MLWAGCWLVVLALHFPPAHAEEPPTVEVSGGGEIGGHVWSAQTNTTVALAAWLSDIPKSIREDGWRLRAGAGYWEYARRQTIWISGLGEQSVRRKRTGSFADVLLGYQAGFGALTLKVFAGGAYANEQRLINGEDEGATGPLTEAKVLAESWYDFTPNTFGQLDAGWTSRLDAITARGRLGYRLTPNVSLGPEVGYWSAARELEAGRDEVVRYGGFVRHEWAGGEVSLSAGLADGAEGSDFYATLNALLRF
ncbi:MAG: cellulose biosynthesis protein BcsS [Hyphomicrobiaceae bacterium]